nr:immunoglobulin domain-containing protein [Bacteroidota bacterium]
MIGYPILLNMHLSNTELKGTCTLYGPENHFSNVTITDTLLNYSSYYQPPQLLVDGDFINNGVISNVNSYRIDLRVDGNFYNNGKTNCYKIIFTGASDQHFYSPVFPITETDIESTKTGGIVLADDDVLLEACDVSFDLDVLSLEAGNLYTSGGSIIEMNITGNGNKLIVEGNGSGHNIILDDISIEGKIRMGGNDNVFNNVTLTDSIIHSNGYNAYTFITTTGNFINNGHILDADNYGIYFYIQDIVINNGEWISDKLVFDGDDMHYIQSLNAMPFEVADITVSALGGDVSITDYLYLLNTDVDLNGQNLYIPDAGILDLDNSSISDAMVFGDDFSTINGSNDAWLSGSTFNSVFISGSIDTRVNTYVDCVLDGLLQNDDYSVHPTVVFEGNFTNDGSIINRPSYNYDLYANIFGHVYNYGTWEIDECRWQGSSDQDIYLMEASEINTPSEFQAMIGTTGFQWYKNDILIGGATTYHLDFTSITAAERGYYHCVTNEGSSRTITVCTPLDIDLDAEAWFCQYESVMLDPQVSAGQGPYTYSWFPVEGLSDPNIQNPLASPTEPTVYKVIITDAIGCEGESDIFVQQYPQLNASAGNDKEICYGFSTSLNGSTWGGEPDYTYEWSPATGLSNPNIANPTASPFSTTFYTLTVTDANGCVETSDASVTVNVLPEAYGLSQDSTHFCYGNDTIICWLLDSQVGVDYHLQVNGVPNPGGEVFAGTGETIPIWATTTVQGHYTLKGINTTTGCQKIMTGSVMIFIDFLPEVVDQSGDEIVLLGDNTTLWVDVTSTQPPWLQWYKDGEMIDGANDHQLQITDANFDDTGEYFCIVTNNCDVTLS